MKEKRFSERQSIGFLKEAEVRIVVLEAESAGKLTGVNAAYQLALRDSRKPHISGIM